MRRFLAGILILPVFACGPVPRGGPERDSGPGSVPDADWPMYRHDPAGTGYSPLAEITADNVADLAPAWSQTLEARPTEGGASGRGAGGRGAPSRGPRSEATPIVVAGTLYVPAQDRVLALDAATGTEMWNFRPEGDPPSRRGVAWWPGADGATPRIVFAAGSTLWALDAATGRPVEEFGRNGAVDLGIPYNSVPLVFGGVIVVGANTPRGAPGGVGDARAYDVRTGTKRWEFHSVPRPGEVGHDTWTGESWKGRLGVNAWPFYFTADVERGLVYLPLAAPIPFAYGGDRAGDDLFCNSVVAVRARTGEYVWHFQTIHHGLWDHDPPAPPVLFDAPRGDSTVPALGVTTKSGYLYLLNRVTGEPLFGVEEKPVPSSEVPGEATSPTQPIPSRPEPLSRVAYDPVDMVTADETSAEHARACRALVDRTGGIVNRGAFTPWIYRPAGSPPRATLLFPGLLGGFNWGGLSWDPDTKRLFAFSQDLGSLGWLEDAGADDPVPYRLSGPRPSSFAVRMRGQLLPCQKPPWGRLFAVDGATGQVAWKRPLGVSDSLPEGRRDTGRPGRAGAIVTGGGLVFIASTDDDRFRALDARTGEELWTARLPRQGNANPMTYRAGDGRQYVAIVAEDRLLTFALGR